METRRTFRYRSVFWPILLIGVGILWLLANLEIIPGVNWRILLRFWPLLLIAVGLDVIFARRTPLLGAILGLGTIGLAILLLFLAPILGLTTSTEVITEKFSEPIGAAKSAEIAIDLSVGRVDLYPLSDSTQLIEAEIAHIGEIIFKAQGQENKSVELKQRSGLDINFTDWPEEELRWDIGLNPQVPLYIELQGGVGEVDMDLSNLQLRSLDVSVDVGGLDLILPAMDEMYDATIRSDVGQVKITILEGAEVKLDLVGDVGGFVIYLPDGAAVRLDAETDVGNIQLPANFRKVSGDSDDFIGESGIWETENYDSADRRIIIEFKGDVSGLSLR
jgi:hypothetical protein